MLNKLLLGVLILTLTLAAAGYFAQDALIRWSEQPRNIAAETIIEFPRGTGLAELGEILENNELISRAELFQLWARFFSKYNRFQAGNYLFQGEFSPRDIAEKIIAGDVYLPIVLEYTIPEGFTFRQVSARLLAKGVGTEEEFGRLKTDPDFLKSHNIPSSSIEGFLYPATYQFTELPTAEQALGKAVEIFWKRLPENYVERVAEKDISLSDAVNIASLIELETAFDNERDLVSEVIWRRYTAGAALAIDASIIYGIEDYAGNITRKHLRDRSNKYNTRVHRGLPPTPIGSPSVASLEAVLTPSNEGWYYYVLDLETGRHQFSKTLKEHNKYVRKLVKETRQRRIQRRKQEADKRRAASSARD